MQFGVGRIQDQRGGEGRQEQVRGGDEGMQEADDGERVGLQAKVQRITEHQEVYECERDGAARVRFAMILMWVSSPYPLNK